MLQSAEQIVAFIRERIDDVPLPFTFGKDAETIYQEVQQGQEVARVPIALFDDLAR